MKVCDVVLNSIWYDPRVRRQIVSYSADAEVELACVGLKCAKYDKEKVDALPFEHHVVSIDEKYDGKQSGVFRKLYREWLRNKAVRNAIIAYKPDIIHANDLNALIPAFLAAKKLKCGLIYDSHEINTENYWNGGSRLYAQVMEAIERYLVKRVDKMICVSNAAAEYFAEHYRIPRPTVVTNSALRADIVKNAPEKAEGFTVLNHGQYYEGRGYELMVGACKYLQGYPEIKLALRGFGKLEQMLRDMKAAEDTEDRVVFYPPVRVEELIPMAASAYVGVAVTLPICLNFKLSVSNKLFEYAAAGLPVIMSDIPEHRYLNEKYNFGILMEENTSQCFAEAAIKLYTDKGLYARLAANAARMVQEVNWDAQFEQLIADEKTIIGNRQLR